MAEGKAPTCAELLTIIGEMDAELTRNTAIVDQLADETKWLRHLVWQYVDPFDVAPEHHALVVAVGTDDEAGIDQALANLRTSKDAAK